MNGPNAPDSAVLVIIETFKGIADYSCSDGDGWLVTFDDDDKFQNALHLINALKGWRAVPHPNLPNIKNMLIIYSA